MTTPFFHNNLTTRPQQESLQQHPKVHHTYRDFSQEVDPAEARARMMQWTGSSGLVAQAPTKPKSKHQQSSFPVRLHYILSGELEKDHMEHIMSWQPHGRAFLVHNREEFVEKVLPSWFSQKCYASFQRQLNLYGFKRISSGPDKGAYYHEYFLRGKAFLAARIQRTKIKGNGGRKACSPETEPDFYRMNVVGVQQTPKPAQSHAQDQLSLRNFLSVNSSVLPAAMAGASPPFDAGVPRSTLATAAHQRVSMLAAQRAALLAQETAAAFQQWHQQQQQQQETEYVRSLLAAEPSFDFYQQRQL